MILEGRRLMVVEGLPAPKSNANFFYYGNGMVKRDLELGRCVSGIHEEKTPLTLNLFTKGLNDCTGTN